MPKKVLNLYAGIGGNRALWKDCHVTAVEYNPEIASVYQDRFKNDTVIITDAHAFLQENYKDFDFIWSSPPCPTHSNFRQNISVRYRGSKAMYPDMSLYQEIIFLKHNCEGQKWCVENVVPYYEPLINANTKLGRHLFWCNFSVLPKAFNLNVHIRSALIPDLEKLHQVNLKTTKLQNKRQVLRNCVDSDVGLYIFKSAFKSEEDHQMELPLFANA